MAHIGLLLAHILTYAPMPVSQIVRQGLQPSRENIEKLAAPLLPSADLSKLIDLVATELTNLHEGSIARFRLRPSEWKEWQESRGAH
jgi:hypothetical protein